MKSNYRCPLCDSPMSIMKFEGTTKEECCMACPDSESKDCFFCNIFCYFYCSKKKVKINYVNILEMINYPKIQDWDEGCEGYAKIYEKIFKRCCFLTLVDKGYEF